MGYKRTHALHQRGRGKPSLRSRCRSTSRQTTTLAVAVPVKGPIANRSRLFGAAVASGSRHLAGAGSTRPGSRLANCKRLPIRRRCVGRNCPSHARRSILRIHCDDGALVAVCPDQHATRLRFRIRRLRASTGGECVRSRNASVVLSELIAYENPCCAPPAATPTASAPEALAGPAHRACAISTHMTPTWRLPNFFMGIPRKMEAKQRLDMLGACSPRRT
jgi:hypothetical protein